MTTQSAETLIILNPDRPLSDFVGIPYTFVTWEGVEVRGHTDIGYDGRLVVRFTDGGWAYARTEYPA